MNKKALALIVGGLIILGLIIYFVFFHDFNKTDVPGDQTGTNTTAEPVISKTTPEIRVGEPRTAEEQSRDAASQLAIAFAERYGTSSSQADFSNLIESEVFMTEAMQQRNQDYIKAQRAKASPAPEYQSIVTQAAIVEFVTFSEVGGTAEGNVKTKRQETAADGEVKTYDQTLSLALKKENGNWKVDRADWK